MKKRVAMPLVVAIAAAGLSTAAVVAVGSPAGATCPEASGGSGSVGGAGGTGGVRCTGTTVFSDDFLSDSTGDCRTALTNWNLAGSPAPPNVDVFFPSGASGQAVDLDGSANICAGDATPVVSLKTPITVVAGRKYTAQFVISTNPSPFAASLPDVNTARVIFGPVSGTFTKQASQQGTFTTEKLTFKATANGTAQLTFEEQGAADRGGIVLDRVDILEFA